MKQGSPPMWERQILHVWVPNKEAADSVSEVVKELHESNNEDFNISVVISIAFGSDFIFSNKIRPSFKYIVKYLKRESPV